MLGDILYIPGHSTQPSSTRRQWLKDEPTEDEERDEEEEASPDVGDTLEGGDKEPGTGGRQYSRGGSLL